MVKISTVETMALDSGNPSVDLVNSGYALIPGATVERLHSYNDLLTLAMRHRLIDDKVFTTLSDHAVHHPQDAEDVLNAVRQVRKLLYVIYNTLSSPEADVDKTALVEFNTFLPDTLAQRKVLINDGQLVGGWKFEDDDLRLPLHHYIFSAYELLTSPHQRFIKKCGRCAWLFLDETKNHTRRWCDMQICGASDKAKRYYQKRKQAGSQNQ